MIRSIGFASLIGFVIATRFLALPALHVDSSLMPFHRVSDSASESLVHVRNLGPRVNGPEQDFAPAFSADGLVMIFVSRRPGGLGYDDFWMSTRKAITDSAWSTPVNLKALNSKDGEGGITFDPDGHSFYFASNRFNQGADNDIDICYATTDSLNRIVLSDLGPPINTNGWESQPSISADGTKLFFAANRKVGRPTVHREHTSIWVSHKLPSGKWSEPKELGIKINVSGSEGSPFIASDGVTLYFSSRCSGGHGGADIYVSKWTGPSDSDWTEPVCLPAPINSPFDEMFYSVPAVGDAAYVTSNRPGGFGKYDIWEITGP